jgi:predicted anti-sigma-YlaC factor YlaD
MNCRQAKLEIALCVGEDLTDADRREQLRRHLTGCPECRTHFKQLKGMFQVLEEAEEQQTYDSADSLWPSLAGRLGQPRPRRQGPRFNGWVPFSVMAAACVLLMIVMETQPSDDTVISGWMGRSFLGIGIHQVEEESTGPREVDRRTRVVLPAEEDESDPPAESLMVPVADRSSSTSTF